MFKSKKVRNLFIVLVLISVFTLVYAQVMVWNETVSWLSDEMARIIQEDNSLKA